MGVGCLFDATALISTARLHKGEVRNGFCPGRVHRPSYENKKLTQAKYLNLQLAGRREIDRRSRTFKVAMATNHCFATRTQCRGP